MKKGILITCLCVLLLSGCGSSSKDAKAIKECKQTDNYTCVTKEVNDMLPSSAKDEGLGVYIGSQLKTGNQVIFKNNELYGGKYNISMSVYDKDNPFSAGISFYEEEDVEIDENSEFVYDLPKEAIGKYIYVRAERQSGAPYLTIEVV